MTSRNKNDQKELTDSEQFTTKTTHEDLAGIRHVLDMRITPFELADNVAGVGGHET